MPTKCTLDISISAIPAGIESTVQIIIIKKYSDDGDISMSESTVEVMTNRPEATAAAPATGFFLTGYTGAVFLSKRLIITQSTKRPIAIPITAKFTPILFIPKNIPLLSRPTTLISLKTIIMTATGTNGITEYFIFIPKLRFCNAAEVAGEHTKVIILHKCTYNILRQIYRYVKENHREISDYLTR